MVRLCIRFITNENYKGGEGAVLWPEEGFLGDHVNGLLDAKWVQANSILLNYPLQQVILSPLELKLLYSSH